MNGKRDKKQLKRTQNVLLDIIFGLCLILLLLFFVKQASGFGDPKEKKRVDETPLTKAKDDSGARQQGDRTEAPADAKQADQKPKKRQKQVESSQEKAPKADLININTADAKQLEQLHGIGEALAERIVAYRNKNGKFKKISDLKRVSGIGERKFEQIKDDICVK